MKPLLFTLLLISAFISTQAQNNLFEYNENIETRWSSPENRNGKKGAGGIENNGAKGHASDSIPAGATYALLDIQGMGIINRIWITINDRSPEMLRSLKIEMYWDGETKPAVSAPFGDFFGIGQGVFCTADCRANDLRHVIQNGRDFTPGSCNGRGIHLVGVNDSLDVFPIIAIYIFIPIGIAIRKRNLRRILSCCRKSWVRGGFWE